MAPAAGTVFFGFLGTRPFVPSFTGTARLAAVWFLACAVPSLSRTVIVRGQQRCGGAALLSQQPFKVPGQLPRCSLQRRLGFAVLIARPVGVAHAPATTNLLGFTRWPG